MEKQGFDETETNLLCDNNKDGKYRIINKYVPMNPENFISKEEIKKRF
jgi:hypothetical protein